MIATTDTFKHWSGSFRLMGLLPLIFFLVQAFHYWNHEGLANLLWMCNVGNLLLAVGLLLAQRELIRAAAVWTLPGLVMWFLYLSLRLLQPQTLSTRLLWLSSFIFSSALAHFGGLAVAAIALRRVRMDRIAWVYAFMWYLLMQVVSRLLTSPAQNVNVAHAMQRGWEKAFSSYWKFWLLMSALAAAGLWLSGKIFSELYPAGGSKAPAVLPSSEGLSTT